MSGRLVIAKIGELNANTNDFTANNEYTPVQIPVIASNPEDIVRSGTFTTSQSNVVQFPFPQTIILTEISILPQKPANTLNFNMQYGSYTLGTISNPLVLVNSTFCRKFNDPHLPVLRQGNVVNIAGYDSAGQNVTVVFSGFRVD